MTMPSDGTRREAHQEEGDRTLVWAMTGAITGERYWEVWLEANGMSLFSNDFSKFSSRASRS